MKSATTTPRNRGGGKTASRIWSWTVDVWALVRGHRSNPIFHPISHPRLRSIRFPRFPRGHRLPPSPPLSRGEKREIAALSTSTGQKAREMDLIRFQPSFSPPALPRPPPSTSSRLSIAKYLFEVDPSTISIDLYRWQEIIFVGTLAALLIIPSIF